MSSSSPASEPASTEAVPVKQRKAFLGLSRPVRFRLYRYAAFLLFIAALIFTWMKVRPDRWKTYTDQTAFERVAADVQPGFVVWSKAKIFTDGSVPGEVVKKQEVSQVAIFSDGARMVLRAKEKDGSTGLFLRRWDGKIWGESVPLRALNSAFEESSPAISGDGKLLYFTSNRPGGRGGKDIWVAQWDGQQYAWPLPLTNRVNTPFDEIDPVPSPDNGKIYFSSNRPTQKIGVSEKKAAELASQDASLGDVHGEKGDFDLYSADRAGDTPFELYSERQLSMLYSLREGALADPVVMRKLGGSPETEAAVDRALAYLASTQEEDGSWDIGKHGGNKGHEAAATGFALLAFYGRGERHDRDCKYRKTVQNGIQWMLKRQIQATGDLRGERPPSQGMYDQGIASLALVEAYGVTKDSALKKPAQRALDFISESQHEGGGWRYAPNEAGDLSVVGWMAMTLASGQMSGLPVSPKTAAGVEKFLNHVRSGKEGGKYGYIAPGGSVTLTAVGLFCSQLAGSSPNTPRALESVSSLNPERLDVGNIYYAYYGTLAAYQHQGDVWKSWAAKLHPDLLKLQKPDGSWLHKGAHSAAMGNIICTALSALCLESHYRYTPLYGLGYSPEKGHIATAGNEQRFSEKNSPLFRHSKRLDALSSPADDISPALTDHGDFLYFSSTRDGGKGGSDIYRARVSGENTKPPVNLGDEINTTADETDPALRMAGFHLLFNSTRDGRTQLLSAKSQRAVLHHDYRKVPPAHWLKANWFWLLLFALLLFLFFYLIKQAFKTPGTASSAAPAPEPTE